MRYWLALVLASVASAEVSIEFSEVLAEGKRPTQNAGGSPCNLAVHADVYLLTIEASESLSEHQAAVEDTENWRVWRRQEGRDVPAETDVCRASLSTPTIVELELNETGDALQWIAMFFRFNLPSRATDLPDDSGTTDLTQGPTDTREPGGSFFLSGADNKKGAHFYLNGSIVAQQKAGPQYNIDGTMDLRLPWEPLGITGEVQTTRGAAIDPDSFVGALLVDCNLFRALRGKCAATGGATSDNWREALGKTRIYWEGLRAEFSRSENVNNLLTGPSVVIPLGRNALFEPEGDSPPSLKKVWLEPELIVGYEHGWRVRELAPDTQLEPFRVDTSERRFGCMARIILP